MIRNRGSRFGVATFSRGPLGLICEQKNDRRFRFAPRITRLARFGFNWRDPPLKNLKSSCSPRHKSTVRRLVNWAALLTFSSWGVLSWRLPFSLRLSPLALLRRQPGYGWSRGGLMAFHVLCL